MARHFYFVYRLQCQCEKTLEITAGQAGTTIACGDCLTLHQIGSVRLLKELPRIRREDHGTPFQFRLKHMILIYIPFAILLRLTMLIGAAPILPVVFAIALYCGFVVLTSAIFHYFRPFVCWCQDRFERQQ